MAHGFERLEEGKSPKNEKKKAKRPTKMGSRRIFSPQFKLQVLDSYRKDSDCRGNQRATARKYGIHRRQIQKWLQMESTLRCTAENGEVALNLASARQRDDTSTAGCLPAHPPSPILIESDSSDSSDPLDLTKRRFFSLDFKLDVLNAFHTDPDCAGNQRATARKYNVHRRQVQKWLDHEDYLRNDQCLDLSKPKDEEKTFLDLDAPQETALCLVKEPSKDLFRPYLQSPPAYEICWGTCCSYYTPYSSCVTKWLHQDAHYYKQAVKDINLYTPMLS